MTSLELTQQPLNTQIQSQQDMMRASVNTDLKEVECVRLIPVGFSFKLGVTKKLDNAITICARDWKVPEVEI